MDWRSNEFRMSPFLYPNFRGVAKAALYCAHRTSTILSCAFCEQEGHLAAPLPSFPGRAFREHRDPPSVPPVSRACIRRLSPNAYFFHTPRLAGRSSPRLRTSKEPLSPSPHELAFLSAWARLRERIRPEYALKNLRAGERLEDGRLFDEVLGCAHAGYHGKSPWRNDQAR